MLLALAALVGLAITDGGAVLAAVTAALASASA